MATAVEVGSLIGKAAVDGLVQSVNPKSKSEEMQTIGAVVLLMGFVLAFFTGGLSLLLGMFLYDKLTKMADDPELKKPRR